MAVQWEILDSMMEGQEHAFVGGKVLWENILKYSKCLSLYPREQWCPHFLAPGAGAPVSIRCLTIWGGAELVMPGLGAAMNTDEAPLTCPPLASAVPPAPDRPWTAPVHGPGVGDPCPREYYSCATLMLDSDCNWLCSGQPWLNINADKKLFFPEEF